jgi:MIP family channel proteins
MTTTSYLVEIVGTFLLVYAIVSAATVYSKSGQLGVIGIGLVAGFALTAIIYAIGYKSGVAFAQVNPAVTLGLLVSGRLTPKKAGLYIVCQFVGAIIASAVVFATFGQSMAAGVTLPSDGNVIRALMLETVMTFTLVYAVLATTAAKNTIAPMAGLAIGFTLGLNVIFGGSVTGASLNPARSFGPALIMGNFSFNWIYWVAPIMGGLIAGGIYKGLHKDADLPLADAETLK